MAVLLASLALPAGAETIYVSNEKDNTLSVVDGASLTVTDTIKVGRRPRGIVFNHDVQFLSRN
jgi:YVTN family beta-propeller protein